jgi:hypothetical protein
MNRSTYEAKKRERSALNFLFLQINQTVLQNVLAYFLFASLAGTLVFIPLNKFFYSRRFGAVLMVLYAAFLVTAILIETHVIG